MKLTWFGGTTLRIHIGGAIVVVDAGSALSGIDRAELLSGADRELELKGDACPLPVLDLAQWRPRRAKRLVDVPDADAGVRVHRIGADSVLIEADGEAPLIVSSAHRWSLPVSRGADACVLVAVGDGMATTAKAFLDHSAPRLIALAGQDEAVDAAFAALRGHAGDTVILAMEPRMAVEA